MRPWRLTHRGAPDRQEPLLSVQASFEHENWKVCRLRAYPVARGHLANGLPALQASLGDLSGEARKLIPSIFIASIEINESVLPARHVRILSGSESMQLPPDCARISTSRVGLLGVRGDSELGNGAFGNSDVPVAVHAAS
jgi:hypothetical protein